ncbi:SDR family oxidoreductase [Iodidimonas gelatinilytica]|uniref:SDR family oxidoreductase n=1 Tax=Iodidimonas gelatinilytica TaxID=1236966 RepID=A0A5A7MN90_9PROT|nr:SDR family NAD(P)-dependent oxidoreductase [Iodidimonas gelatinilytica]GEQ97316.1 SDR family oxidoreductase [Iodidimonas gelatinilytica]GEQ99642.1 SDR family oxidoreductase [Iodidimonas gelatinilytica]
MARPVCAIIGVGPGNGLALAKRFSQGGYDVALLSRSLEKLDMFAKQVDNARTYPCDAADPESLASAFQAVANDMGAVDVLCFNVGGGSWSTPDATTVEDMDRAFRINATGLLCAAQQVIPGMIKKGGGAIMISGATASVRGGPKTTAFAAAKAAQRSVAQSLARFLSPKGIHVALFIIDGVIDLPRTRKVLPDRPDTFFLKADDIADTIFHTARQPKSAWTFEMDLRPFVERW